MSGDPAVIDDLWLWAAFLAKSREAEGPWATLGSSSARRSLFVRPSRKCQIPCLKTSFASPKARTEVCGVHAHLKAQAPSLQVEMFTFSASVVCTCLGARLGFRLGWAWLSRAGRLGGGTFQPRRWKEFRDAFVSCDDPPLEANHKLTSKKTTDLRTTLQQSSADMHTPYTRKLTPSSFPPSALKPSGAAAGAFGRVDFDPRGRRPLRGAVRGRGVARGALGGREQRGCGEPERFAGGFSEEGKRWVGGWVGCLEVS